MQNYIIFYAFTFLSVPLCAAQESTLIHENMQNTFEDLSEIKGDFQHVYHLKLAAKGLYTVPNTIKEMTNLRSLCLSDNKITTLSNVFTTLTQLKILDLDNNDLRQISLNDLTACTQLEALHLRGNNIEKLPSDFGRLKYIQMLDVGENNLARIDTPLYLPYLKKFRADENQMAEIPVFLYQCKNLNNLNLNRNQLKRLDGIEQLRRLHTLNIGDNPLADLSPVTALNNLQHLTLDWITLDSTRQDGFEKLNKLKVLSLENCNLERIPEWVLLKRQLEELSLIGNHLTEIPAQMFKMNKLKKLWLGKNPIPTEQVEALRSKLRNCEIYF